MTTRQIEVQIMGQSYLLGSPDGGEERLRAAVEKVDATMTRIRDGGKVRARDRIAVLAALNLAFDLADRPLPAPSGGNARASSADPMQAQDVGEAGSDAERWQDLIRRLDAALGQDGRLL
jgi:cell division protein ZapA